MPTTKTNMSLTEEDKQRILEEEAYRQKLREEEAYRKQLSQPAIKRKSSKLGKIALTIIVGFFALIIIANIASQFTRNTSDNLLSPSPTSDNSDLDGAVNFKGGIVTFTNNESKNWAGCYARLNNDYAYPSDISSKVMPTILAGEQLEIPSAEFTKKDGTRFKYFQTKPKSIALSCNDRFGYWEW